MNILESFLIEYVPMLIYTMLMGLISYLGYRAQQIYEKYLNDKLKREQADMVCQAINQLYSNLSNEEKLSKAIENLKTIFLEKSIPSTELELRLLIESSVHKIKKINI